MTPSKVYEQNNFIKTKNQVTYTINSLGWHTVVATPPIVHQGFITVWPPVTDVLASSAASWIP